MGLTDGRGPWVLKSVTDSGGFDSPRSSHTRSLKTPSETRGEDEERGGAEGLRRERGTKASLEWSGLAAAAAAASF